MSFKDLLDKYNTGNASKEEIKFIEEELHKHEAIAEYLTESYNISFENEVLLENTSDETSLIKRNVNKKLRKVILASVSIVFLIFFIIYYIASPIVSNFYYNPSQKTVGRYNEDLFYDLRVFTELNLPGYTISGAGAEVLGFGKYNIYIQRMNLFNRKVEDINAKINRDTRIGTWQDFFASDHLGLIEISRPDINKNKGIEIESKKTIDHINELNPVSYISAYIIFNEDISVAQFDELMKKHSDKVNFKWAGVRTKGQDDSFTHMAGFNPNFNDGPITGDNADKNKYPYLELVDYMTDEYNRKNRGDSMVEGYTKHFTSLLKYMNDRKEMVKALDKSPIKVEYYKNALEYVEKNGINIYGVLVHGEARELLEFIDNENIKFIEIKGVLPSRYRN